MRTDWLLLAMAALQLHQVVTDCILDSRLCHVLVPTHCRGSLAQSIADFFSGVGEVVGVRLGQPEQDGMRKAWAELASLEQAAAALTLDHKVGRHPSANVAWSTTDNSSGIHPCTVAAVARRADFIPHVETSRDQP